MSAPPIDVWLIEDNAAYRRSMARTIGTFAGFRCPEAYARAEEALAALGALAPPRIMLLDVGLPGIDGISAIPKLRERAPEAAIVILTVFDDEEKIVRAICAGASGYLLKATAPEEIHRALREVLAGGAPMNGRVAKRVLEMFSRLAPKQNDYRLTEREQQILELMVGGFIKKEIADQLGLSVHTVDSHLRNIYGKLQVNTRTGAVAKAVREGLV